MDPVSQIFLQAQAPTGKSNTGFEAFVQGRQLAQRDRQLNMQQREQDALLQLQTEAEVLQNQSTGLDIQLKLLAKQRELDVKQGQAELMQLMLGAKNTPEGILGTAPGAMAIASKYGASVFATPLGQAWFNNYRGVGVMQSGMERLQQQAAQAGLPAGKMTLDEKTGLPVTTFERPDTGQTPRIVQLQNERSRLQALGTEPQRLAEIDKAILNEQTETGEVIETLPGGGFRIVRGKGARSASNSDLTTANVTKAQETLTSAEDALKTVLQILPLWSGETTGPLATAGRAMESTVGHAAPALLTSESRSRIDTLAPVFQGQIARLFRSDAQMAEAERKAIAEAVPKPGATLNPVRASQQGQAATLVLIQRARRASEQLGQPLPPGLNPIAVANQVRQAVAASGLPVIEGFKTVDELRAELRLKQRGKSPEEQQRLLREYVAKIEASPYRDLAVPSATTPASNSTLDFMMGR